MMPKLSPDAKPAIIDFCEAVLKYLVVRYTCVLRVVMPKKSNL